MGRAKRRRMTRVLHRLGYALYAQNLMTGDGRTAINGKGYVRALTFDMYERIKTAIWQAKQLEAPNAR